MKNAIIYARYSSERQNEQSIESQLRVCNEYAQHNGLNIIDSYIDKAMTGTNDNRPAFQKMLSDSERPGAFEIVFVYAIDRFGRNYIEIAVNKQRLKKNGKTLISATQRTSENIDGTKNLDGILLENVYIGLAEYYSAELSQKVSRGLQENRNKGLFTGGRVPIGYKVINKKVVIDEARLFFTEPATIVYPNLDGRGSRRNPARKIKTPLRVLYFGGLTANKVEPLMPLFSISLTCLLPYILRFSGFNRKSKIFINNTPSSL